MTNDLNDLYFYCINNQRVMLLKEPCFKSCKLLCSPCRSVSMNLEIKVHFLCDF